MSYSRSCHTKPKPQISKICNPKSKPLSKPYRTLIEPTLNPKEPLRAHSKPQKAKSCEPKTQASRRALFPHIKAWFEVFGLVCSGSRKDWGGFRVGGFGTLSWELRFKNFGHWVCGVQGFGFGIMDLAFANLGLG